MFVFDADSYPELIPHSENWFKALEKISPQQAAYTRQIVELVGDVEVCGVCGCTPAHDCMLSGTPLPYRRCQYCRDTERAA